MKKLYPGIILIALTAIILSSCKKDTDIFVPDPGQVTGPDTTWYSPVTLSMPVHILESSLLLSPDIDSIDAGDNADTINSASGLQCIFPPNSCVDSNGSAISGKVYVESFLLKNKGSFISMGLPAVSNGNVLASGGAFSVRLRTGNSYLQLAPGASLNISYNDTGISQQMKLFNGATTTDGVFNWIEDKNSDNKITPENDGYDITTNQLNWINCDRFYGDTSATSARTAISVKLPSNLTNANTVAYLVFNDIRSVMTMTGDFNTRQFISGRIPLGLNVTIITISKDGNFYYLGQSTTTTALSTGTATQEFIITPTRYSINDIRLFLSNL